MSIVDKVKQMLGQQADRAKHGVEKAGDMFDQRTGGKHADKVDRVQDQADETIDRESGQAGGTGGPHGETGDQPGGTGEQPGGTGDRPS
ncbi:antitoxin [Spirillospora sp. CA-108201]